MIFGAHARSYWKAGLSPLPIRKGAKSPCVSEWSKYCLSPLDEETLKAWEAKYADNNLGLCLGTQLSHHRQLVAIDVDAPDLLAAVLDALPSLGPSKRGQKGLTIFAQADSTLSSKKWKRAPEDRRPAVEFLAVGCQTVIPPSIHPETQHPYEWVGPSLLETDFSELPLINDSVYDELIALVAGKGEHFNALSHMVWLGSGGGGNIHDTCVAAVACMVARGWADSDIRERVIRAQKVAVERHGDTYDWSDADREIDEWIESAKRKGMDVVSAPRGKRVPAERQMADWAVATLGGYDNVRCLYGQIRQYHNGHWRMVDMIQLRQKMLRHDEFLRDSDIKAAIKDMEMLTSVSQWPVGDAPRICLANETLNLRTGALEQWSPDHYLLHQLNFNWDDEAECVLYNRVVQETFNGDEESIQFWDEYAALSLVDDMSFQKVLILRGPGGNGKGTIARVLRDMHAPEAVGSVAITDLNDERKRTSLVGKLINISGEQSRMNMVADSYLKKITGGDPVDIRKLYGETQNNVQLSVRFLELVNEMPATLDSSEALRRRLVILECPNRVQMPDTTLDSKLYRERPGILRRLAGAIQKLYRRGGFLIPESSHKAVGDYLLENDPVKYWLLLRIEATPDERGTPTHELYADFKNWYDVMGYKGTFPEVQWGRRLTALGHPARVTRVGPQVARFRQLAIRPGCELPY